MAFIRKVVRMHRYRGEAPGRFERSPMRVEIPPHSPRGRALERARIAGHGKREFWSWVFPCFRNAHERHSYPAREREKNAD